MKTRRFGWWLPAVCACSLVVSGWINLWGQVDSVALAQADIQSLVYTGHLTAVLDDRPELEAALWLLLELDRRNPQADPAALVAGLRGTAEDFRNGVLARWRHSPPRDELIAGFVHEFALRSDTQSLRPATLSVLNDLVADSYAATTDPSVRTHAGNEEVLVREHAQAHRSVMISAVVDRSHASAAFAGLVDAVLEGQSTVSVWNNPARILEECPVLRESPTMVWLGEVYDWAAGGPVEVPLSQLEDLFRQEMAIMRETAVSNQSLCKQLESEQGDMSAYLADPARVAEQAARQQQAQTGQGARISACGAAAESLSFMMREARPQMAEQMRTVANSLGSIARALKALDSAEKFSKLAACTDFISAGLNLVSLFIDTGPTAEEIILEEIQALKQMIHDLAVHMDYRFDRVDQALEAVMDQLDYSIQLIGETGHDVDEVRLDLLDVQTGLCRLERELYTYLNAGFRRTFVERLNGDLQFEARTGEQMAWTWYRDTAENTFYSWAVSHSKDELSSYWPAPGDLADSQLAAQLQARPLESNLNYIKEFLVQRLGLPQLSSKPVPNPRDWFAGAEAYLKLAVENPLHYRRMSRSRLDDVIATGRDIGNFLGAFTLTPAGQPNHALFDAVLGYYGQRLDALAAATSAEELQYCQQSMQNFACDMWREWEDGADTTLLMNPAVTGTYKAVAIPADIIQIAAGNGHMLALRANGTVIAWGYNANGQCDVPAGAVGVVAVEAGAYHSLALRADGTVVAWGSNGSHACDVPAGLAGVVAIDAGPYHNLALRSDGTVVTWGYLTDQPAWQVPAGLDDVVGIAAGGDTNRDTGAFSLALRSNGSVVAWGSNGAGECNVPAALAAGGLDVVQVAAGMQQAAAVLADGSLIGWPETLIAHGPVEYLHMFSWGTLMALRKDGTVEVLDGNSQGAPVTNDIIGISGGNSECVALHADGHLTMWGSRPLCLQPGTAPAALAALGSPPVILSTDGQLISQYALQGMPAGLPPITGIATGQSYYGAWYVALGNDGKVYAWGENSKGQCNVPAGLADVVAVSAGLGSDGAHSLALRRDGSVVGWGDNSFGQRDAPAGLTGAVAIAAGWRHSAALKSDGTVVTWGNNWYGQQNIPAGLKNVVAISSRYSHVLALKADGTVVAWGENGSGQCNVPAGLSGVVAVEAGRDRSLALRADGTVAAWGNNSEGACTYANSMTGVVAMAMGDSRRDNFIVGNAFASDEQAAPTVYHRRVLPGAAVHARLATLYGHIVDEFAYDLNEPSAVLTGAKGLLRAVTTLALPLSLERDDALRGFLLGSEGVGDAESVKVLYQSEAAALNSPQGARTRDLPALLRARLEVFAARLDDRLAEVAAAGSPELPRMVAHTLNLLEILRSAHHSGATPSPVFDAADVFATPSGVSFTLRGEPYIRYTLDRTNDPAAWPLTGLVLRSGETVAVPPQAQAIFIRARVP